MLKKLFKPETEMLRASQVRKEKRVDQIKRKSQRKIVKRKKIHHVCTARNWVILKIFCWFKLDAECFVCICQGLLSRSRINERCWGINFNFFIFHLKKQFVQLFVSHLLLTGWIFLNNATCNSLLIHILYFDHKLILLNRSIKMVQNIYINIKTNKLKVEVSHRQFY